MRIILFFLACLLMATPAIAVTRVQEIEGRGGQKAWLIEDHALPIVTVRVELRHTGSAYDEEGKEGLANFVTQMLSEGAGNMDSLAFNRALEEHAIRFGADAGEDSIVTSLQTLSEFKKDAFSLFALALHKPRFDKDAVGRIRSALLTEIRETQEDPSYLASLNWKAVAFVNHPYQHARLGDEESVRGIERADLQHYAESKLSCSSRIISVIGDMTADETRKLIAMLSVPKGCAPPQEDTVADVKMPEGGAPVMVKIAVPQTVVQASLPAVAREDKRYYALVVLNHIFGGSVFTSRLGQEIRNKRGLAYYADSEIDELEHAACISVHFATRREQADKAVGIFVNEANKIRDKGVTRAELDAAKRYLTGSFPLGLDNQEALAEYVTQMQRYHLGRDYLEKRNSLINAVTLNEVNELAKELFSAKPIIVMAGMPNGETQ